jgi:hypothetical protein
MQRRRRGRWPLLRLLLLRLFLLLRLVRSSLRLRRQ